MPYAVLFAAAGSDDFQPLEGETHETGPAAADRMKELQAQDGQDGRFKVRQVAEADVDPDAWRGREMGRFHDDTYFAVPWHGSWWNDELRYEHYCHLSRTQPGKIAYTASPEHGRADRQTTMTPGRYLNKYFSKELSADEIENYAAEVSVSAGACNLSFTSCPDEIQEVYECGPNSCMSHSEDDYHGHCHPVRAYGNSPDLQLAYIGAKDAASGRCIVWPDKKLYSTPYGDCSRMRLLLREAGYSSGDLTGARLKPITDKNGNGYIMPYIDSIGYAHLDDEGFIVLGEGSIHCQSTEGVSDEDGRPNCAYCGDRYDEDEGAYIDDVGASYCEHCTDNYTFYCERSGEYYRTHRQSSVEVWRLGFNASPTTITVAECNMDDEPTTFVDELDAWIEADPEQLADVIRAVASATCADPDQLRLALETHAPEALEPFGPPAPTLAASDEMDMAA